MRRFSIPTTLLLFAAPSFGQAFTSPPGYLTKEGEAMAKGWSAAGGVSLLFGFYANARYQYADGLSRGKIRVINSIGYRLDFRSHTTNYSAPGRKWSNVTLKISETDIARMTNVWTRNSMTNQTQVFNSAVTWPSQSGKPGGAAPAPWDKKLAFPFNSPWRYSGKQDILQDYVFRGGTLANNAVWSGNTPRFYFLDGLRFITNIWSDWHGVPTTSTCMDPAALRIPPFQVSADSIVQYSQFSKAYTTVPAWTDKVVIQGWTDRTAPRAPVVQAIGIAALKGGSGVAGVPFPGSCHNLIIDLSKGAVLLFKFTDFNGLSPPTATIAGPVSVINAITGLRVWSQAAWIHSKTKFFTLSRATVTENPSHMGMNDKLLNKRVSYWFNTTSTTGTTPAADATIIRYN